MGKQQYSLDDYVDVPARMAWFFSTYPEGSLQSSITTMTDSYVIVQAVAYRTPGDLAPGIGHAYEPIPGRTPFTNGSEVMNAETSAWGRALAAIGAPTKGHIASADEVRSRSEGEQTGPATEVTSKPPPGPPSKPKAPKAAPKAADHDHDEAGWEPVPGKEGVMERCRRCGVARKVTAPVPADHVPFTDRENPWEKS